jgi:hypothetical protein
MSDINMSKNYEMLSRVNSILCLTFTQTQHVDSPTRSSFSVLFVSYIIINDINNTSVALEIWNVGKVALWTKIK